MPAPTSPTAREMLRFFRILYWVLVFSVLLYVFLLFEITKGREGTLNPLVYYLISGVAASVGLAVMIIRFVRIQKLLSFPPGAAGVPGHDMADRLAKLRFWNILVWVLCESVVLYGFALGMLASNPYVGFPHIGFGLFLFALCYPQIPRGPFDAMSGPIG